MKIIFSRKGFDSTAGGIPSIKIEKNLQSLPIPYKKNTLTTYNHLNLGTTRSTTTFIPKKAFY